MIFRTLTVTGTVGILCVWLVSFSNPFVEEVESGSEMFTVLHRVNLPSEEAETELAAVLEKFNKVLKETGYDGVRYRLRKQKSGRTGEDAYFIESTWPDRTTYEKVHRLQAWKDLNKKYREAYRGTNDEEEVHDRDAPHH